jgi:hypothetical protein
MKGTKRSKPYSARPVTSYFQSASQIASSSQSVAAQESDTNVGGSGTGLEHTIPPEQQQVSPHIVVNMEDANTSTHEEGLTVELNPDDIVADPGLRKPIEELDVNVRDAARREYLVMGSIPTSWSQISRKINCKPNGEISREMV